MLLALDVGNSNITIGLFDNGRAHPPVAAPHVHDQTADEWGILLRNLFSLAGLHLANVDGIIIASVVPPLDSTLAACRSATSTRIRCSWALAPIGPHHPLRQSPRGRRRPLVNGVAAFQQVRRPVRGGGSRNHHQLRRDLEGRRIPGRRHRGGNRDGNRSAVSQDRAPAAGGSSAPRRTWSARIQSPVCNRVCTTARWE